MRKKIKGDDLKVLLELIAPKGASYAVFDPFLRLDDPESLPEEPVDTQYKVLINLGDEVIRFKSYELEDFDTVIDFGQSKCQHKYFEKVQYKLNAQGDMRWLFKASNLRHVLSTYSANNLRSKLISFGIKLMSKLGLSSTFSSGSFRIHSNVELPIHQYLKSFDEGIVFMGTPGYYRKVTIAKIQHSGVSEFIKVPISFASERNILNEKRVLEWLPSYQFTSFEFPDGVKKMQGGALKQNNRLSYSFQQNQFTRPVQLVLSEIASVTMKQSLLWNVPMINAVQNNLEILKGNLRGIYLECFRSAEQMFNSIPKTQEIYTTFAHGDFTPWNLKLNKDSAYVYDWEFARSEMPLFYDAFHFLIQSSIYTKKGKRVELKQVLKDMETSQLYEQFESYNIDLKSYLKLYVLHQLTHHLVCVFIDRKVSEGLQNQLFQLYALGGELMREEDANSFRTAFLQRLQLFLSKSTGYAMLKLNVSDLSELPETSDLDILVSAETKKELLQFVHSFGWKITVKSVNKSFMSQWTLRFFDGSILHIDLIKSFRRKLINYMEASEVIERSFKLSNGLSVPTPEHDFEYAFLFYNLNGQNIPQKYYRFFAQDGDQQARVLKYVNTKYSLELDDYDACFTLETSSRNWLKTIVKHQSMRQPITILSNTLMYALDALKSVGMDRGFVITFSGVDGSGKSTVIENFKRQIRTIHRREVVLLRHRPRVLPILSAIKFGGVKNAERKAGDTKPRQGTPYLGLSSILRFGYYFTDYLLGQVYVYFKYILKGKIVLYDRYYFDFIVDAKRSNIQFPQSISRRLYFLIHKPRYNFLLWANPQDVYRRKPEVEPDQIALLNDDYKKLFKDLGKQSDRGSQYRIIHNQQIQTTIKSILSECREVA